MAIVAQCRDCGKKYRVRDSLAGRSIACENCGNAIRVRGASSSSSSDRSKANDSDRRGARKKSGVKLAPILIGAACLVAVGIGFSFMGSNSGQENAVANSDPSAPKYLTAAQIRECENELKVWVKPEFQVKVIINGAPDDPDFEIFRRLKSSAEEEVDLEVQRAKSQTEQNQKSAEARAAEELKRSREFMKQYQYQTVEPRARTSMAKGGPISKGKAIYFAGPVFDMQAFVSRCRIGTATFDGRTITIASTLSDPIPEMYLEDLRSKFGAQNITTLEITDVSGDPSRIMKFLRSSVTNLASKGNPYSVIDLRVKPKDDRTYVALVLNVNDVVTFSSQLELGDIEIADQSQRHIRIRSKIPQDNIRKLSPDEELELAEENSRKLQREQEEAEERQAAARELNREKMAAARNEAAERQMEAIKRIEGDLNPKEGEEEIDWAIRVLGNSDQRFDVVRKALAFLADNPVVEERRAAVEGVLIKLLVAGTHSFHSRSQFESALENWYSEKLLPTISQGIRDAHGRDTGMFFRILGNHPSSGAAKAVAQKIGDFFVASEAASSLRQMGSVAEDAVLAYVEDRNYKVRTEAYMILGDIGTRKSLGKLAACMNKERDKATKEGLKNVISQIRDRMKEEKPADDEKPEKK